jgi:hypothetical protein
MSTTDTPPRQSARVTDVQRVVEQRALNPLLRWLLQSRLHWLVSRWILLVSYEGRQSGRRYTFPVVYLQRDGRLVVVTPYQESSWWKNFVTPLDCTVWLRGAERSATGALVSGDERATLLAHYFEMYAIVGRLLRIRPSTETAAEQYDDLAVVQFRL